MYRHPSFVNPMGKGAGTLTIHVDVYHHVWCDGGGGRVCHAPKHTQAAPIGKTCVQVVASPMALAVHVLVAAAAAVGTVAATAAAAAKVLVRLLGSHSVLDNCHCC